MCGRFVMISEISEIVECFDVERVSSPGVKSYNRAPGSDVAVLIRDDDGARRLVDMSWGIAPYRSARSAHNPGRKIINARSETVDRKPTFRDAFRKRRCLVIANGYYEWQPRGGKRIPWYINFESPCPMGLAALYNGPDDGEKLSSCVIITSAADGMTRSIHDRMPVAFSRDRAGSWLDPGSKNSDLMKLLQSHLTVAVSAWEVSTLVNSPINDFPSCIEPLSG
ncbi:MAG: SOS response-associated peptidase [Syntrophales bacterium]|nr:SOS response-associated peptidase [Syntrophales bacterium]